MRSSIASLLAITDLAIATNVPSLDVPACPRVGTISYSKSVPNKTDFPLTKVDLCYTKTSISLNFSAYNETNFYLDPSQGTNDDIWEYEVMEAFISKGTGDPQTYLEFEINPADVTYQAFIYNPAKDVTQGAAFDHFFITDPAADGFSTSTTTSVANKTWISHANIPLGLFNVDNGTAKGTQWRMNFFRTITDPAMFPDQELGAWSPPNKASFHITKYFGHVRFV